MTRDNKKKKMAWKLAGGGGDGLVWELKDNCCYDGDEGGDAIDFSYLFLDLASESQETGRRREG